MAEPACGPAPYSANAIRAPEPGQKRGLTGSGRYRRMPRRPDRRSPEGPDVHGASGLLALLPLQEFLEERFLRALAPGLGVAGGLLSGRTCSPRRLRRLRRAGSEFGLRGDTSIAARSHDRVGSTNAGRAGVTLAGRGQAFGGVGRAGRCECERRYNRIADCGKRPRALTWRPLFPTNDLFCVCIFA